MNSDLLGMLHAVMSEHAYHYFQGLTNPSGDFEAVWSTGYNGRGDHVEVRIPGDGSTCYVNERAVPTAYTLRGYLEQLLTPVTTSCASGHVPAVPHVWKASPAICKFFETGTKFHLELSRLLISLLMLQMTLLIL